MKALYYPLSLITFVVINSCTKPEPDTPIIEPDASEVLFSETIVDESGAAVKGATLALWTGNQRYATTTDGRGTYNLLVDAEEFPRQGQIALSLYHPEHYLLPLVYSAPLSGGTTYRAEGSVLQSCAGCLNVSTPAGFAYELFHLGDDSYTGSVNSQFQKSTDAVEGMDFTFVATGSGTLKVSFYAKGVQDLCTDNTIALGGSHYELSPSPGNGDYQKYIFKFAPVDGPQTLRITTGRNCSGDRDDWEFIGLTVEEE